MRYTTKLRVLIFAIAIIPVLIIILFLKFSTEEKLESAQNEQMAQSLKQIEGFILFEQGKLRYNLQELIKDKSFIKLLYSKKNTIQKKKNIIDKYDFRFLYIADNLGEIIYSYGKFLKKVDSIPDIENLLNRNLLTKEIDQQGAHGSLTYVSRLDSLYYIYAGRYIDQSMVYLIESISDASLNISFDEINYFKNTDRITATKDGYKVDFLRSQVDTLSITLDFQHAKGNQIVSSIISNIVIIAISIIFLLLIIGFYFTHKTKKEIDNLQIAFADVAEGNFNTTVMAYEKSEFSELADSFSEMVLKLKTSQSKLSTVEKIAAWETVGQKLAHEIKNPLSPISIAADDLRSSYYEKLPNFDKVVDETTSTIKKEVKRMTILLDEFVSFARMKKSDLKETNFKSFLKKLQKNYTKEITTHKLHINSKMSNLVVNLDSDTFMQLCINLIKNGFESNINSIVEINITEKDRELIIVISDNGPGFTETKLQNSFRPFETTKIDGSGLGLVICHQIIIDHSGSMTLQNNKNKGGKVVITLPII